MYERIGLNCWKNGCALSKNGPSAFVTSVSAGSPSSDAWISGPRSRKRLLEVGREVAERAHRRREVVGRRLQVLDHRARLRGEARDALDGRLRLVEERREDPDRLGELAVTRRRRVEGAVGVHDQLAQRAALLVQRSEDGAGVAHDPRDGRLLLVEHPQELGAVDGEALEVPERVVQRLRRVDALVAHRLGELARPLLERVAGRLVERAEDLVELDGRLDAAVLQPAAVGQLGAVSASPASARGSSRRAASSGAGSRACPRGSARTARRSRPRRACGGRPRRAPCSSPCRRSRRRSGRPPRRRGSAPRGRRPRSGSPAASAARTRRT